MQLVTSLSVHEISAWPGSEAALDDVVQGISSAAPGQEEFLLAIAPQRYWLARTDSTEAHTQLASVDSNRLAVTDISHALSCIRLSGSCVQAVLRKGLPIDLHPKEFPPGSVATSAIEGIVVTVCNTGTSYDVYCRRSFTASLSHWLTDADQEFMSTT